MSTSIITIMWRCPPRANTKRLLQSITSTSLTRKFTEKVHENDTPEVKRFLMGSVELTTLKTTDSDESVLAFTERVNQFENEYPDLPHVATICVYPRFAKVVSETLEVEGVEIACVSGSFPSSQASLKTSIPTSPTWLRSASIPVSQRLYLKPLR